MKNQLLLQKAETGAKKIEKEARVKRILLLCSLLESSEKKLRTLEVVLIKYPEKTEDVLAVAFPTIDPKLIINFFD